jgi:hypothetical protein
MLSLGEVGFQENGGNNSFLSSGIGESEDSSYCIGITVPYKITSLEMGAHPPARRHHGQPTNPKREGIFTNLNSLATD